YSDWAGYKQELRESQRHIWHWRDWIIEALNEDVTYDQMVRLMLAADETAPSDMDSLRATGFLARSYFRDRDQWLDNVVKHTSQAFMGVTLGCAKCHDHMYDPIPQTDYYAMRAIFEPHNIRHDRLPGSSEIAKNGVPRAYDNALGAVTYLFDAGDERRPLKDRPIAPGVPAALGGTFEPQKVDLPEFAWQPDRRDFMQQEVLAAAKKKVADAKDPLAVKAAELQLAALEAELAIEDLQASGVAPSESTFKEAAINITSLQREAAVAEAARKLAQADKTLSTAEEALAAASADDKPAQTKAQKEVDTAKKAVADATTAQEKADAALQSEPSEAFTRREQKA
ncbi:MAG: DUF1549 domain-containing protein, partial [Planctomycetales bacterium]|nr:DUF1549 domain-containing protein [Planctomycetales bacterium]